MSGKTLFEKVWNSHVVTHNDDGTDLIYIDRHLLHEVTSPQAFEGLTAKGRKVRRTDLTLAVPDHNVPTTRDRLEFIKNDASRIQLSALKRNVSDFKVPYFELEDPRQGIVHVVGPEQGFTQPGMTIVCGDSHTATHGAFGAIAFGIGTSQVEHVLATQTLPMKRPKTMRIHLEGALAPGLTSKDLVMAIIGTVGTAGGTGHMIEYTGEAIRALSMEARMTVCNMSIEAGARGGMIAPDDTTFDYLEGRPMAPKGSLWEQAKAYWKTLKSDPGAHFDKEVSIDLTNLEPQVTWGTSPQQVIGINEAIPCPSELQDPVARATMERALDYMGLEPGECLADVEIQHVFLGSCTNGRIEDLRIAAKLTQGHQVKEGVRAMVVPGSGLVKQQAEEEGLHHIFQRSGWEWRESGCSMCVALNPDKVPAGERCASTSNRNFEGRQGPGARTHLVSPTTAALAAITGRFVDVRQHKEAGVAP